MGELEMASRERSGGMQEVAQSRQAQEVQAAVIMARRFPRDKTQAISRIMEDCSRKGLAQKAVYSYPRGGTTVTGPSIRLAETIARAWGNMDCGVVELERRASVGNLPGESTVQAFCWDMETNTRVTKTFTVAHRRDTKQGGKSLTDERDIYELVANNGARRLRACILAIIPIDVVEQAVEECEHTMTTGHSKPLIDRVRDVVLEFKKIGVTQEMIEKRFGHKIDVTTEIELVKLHQIGLSITDQVAKREDFFDISIGMDVVEDTAEPKVAKQKTKTIKNLPFTKPAVVEKEETEDEEQEPAEAAPFSRLDMSKLIAQEVKRLKLTNEKANALIFKTFKKESKELSDGEMSRLIDLLGTMEPGKSK